VRGIESLGYKDMIKKISRGRAKYQKMASENEKYVGGSVCTVKDGGRDRLSCGVRAQQKRETKRKRRGKLGCRRRVFMAIMYVRVGALVP
jgi:hypothetical protein